MPYLLLLLGQLARIAAVATVVKILTSLGVGYLTIVGINTLIESFTPAISSTFSNIDPQVIGVIGLARLDIAANIVLSAINIRVCLTFCSGAFRRLSMIAPGTA